MVNYYALDQKEIFESLSSSDNGLKEKDIDDMLVQQGYNELNKEERSSVFKLFFNQFKDFLIILLLIATVISLLLGEVVDAIAIFAIVLLSAGLGFYQEYNAEKAIEALKKLSAPEAKVIRDGKEKKIPARGLVPGDVILLEAGDIIPADSRLIEAISLKIDESSLTGESVAIEKKIDKLKEGVKIADQKNMAFMSSIVTYGRGKAIVTNTGMNTEIGKIAKSLSSTKEVSTPLQKKFGQMAKQIGTAVLALVFIVFIAGYLRGGISITEMFMFSLSLAVAAVPSSLPAIVTIGLSMGTKTLASKNMIIKKLPAAESLGSATVICSDKTGTLTRNEMTVRKIYVNDEVIDVSGSGYKPEGEFSVDAKKIDLLLKIGYLCNSAQLVKEKGRWNIIGDPTEGALVVLGKKGNVNVGGFSKVDELPFDSDRKRMSVIYGIKGKRYAYVKGAPDLLLSKCDRIYVNGKIRKLNSSDRKKILSKNEEFGSNALRVLGMAYKDVKSGSYTIDNVEKGLVFVGLVGMIDPARQEVKKAIEECHDAGIKVIVITGDHAITTKAVAKEIGLFEDGDIVITGEDLDKMDDKELLHKIESIRIIARALPIQKSRVVSALKKKGHIVAMTGDGVNDAPALKKADIGIAMGITGTDVAKEVSKATLVDDNFATIVNAIEEGRNIYDKIIKSTRYLLSCNAGEIVAVFLSIILRFPLPMIPLQILLMNLVTDGMPALGLGVEPSDIDVMNRRPRNPKEYPLNKQMIMLIVVFGLVMGAGTLFLFNRYYSDSLVLGQTIAFTTLVMFEMFAVFGSRSLKAFKKLNPFTNKWLTMAVVSSILIQIGVIYFRPLQEVFGTMGLGVVHWLEIIGVSFLGFLVMEVSKKFIGSRLDY